MKPEDFFGTQIFTEFPESVRKPARRPMRRPTGNSSEFLKVALFAAWFSAVPGQAVPEGWVDPRPVADQFAAVVRTSVRPPARTETTATKAGTAGLASATPNVETQQTISYFRPMRTARSSSQAETLSLQVFEDQKRLGPPDTERWAAQLAKDFLAFSD